jgi:D-serine deaminase-like pyridoxal phosphate-dependent protein
VSRNISQLSDIKISADFKGFPLSAQGKTISEFLRTKPNIFTSDFLFPVLLLKESALKNNILNMKRFCDTHKVKLGPHVKTTMSPQLANLQLQNGAAWLTIANLQQLLVFKDFGFKDFFIANEVANDAALIQIGKINAAGEAKIAFCVDSSESASRLAEICKKNPGLKFEIFIEIGADNARAGLRDLSKLEMILSILKIENIIIGGISGFEGALPKAGRSKKGLKAVAKFTDKLLSALEISEKFCNRKLKLTAGGSAFFDVVAKNLSLDGKNEVILRSGGYLTHDHVHYEEIYPFKNTHEFHFEPALELCSEVLSTPQPDLSLLNFGKRDVGNDLDNPVPLWKISASNRNLGISAAAPITAKITQLNDQHGFLQHRALDIKYADVIGLGISHPCTNFDKWKILFMVNEKYDVIDCIHTYF